MNKFLIVCILGLLVGQLGCYYDSEEELYPTLDCQTEGVTYSMDILPLLQNNCYECHRASVNFGNVTLEGFDNLKTYVNSGQFLGAIRHEAGYSFMPKNRPQLVECNIQKIEAWVAQGALNN